MKNHMNPYKSWYESSYDSSDFFIRLFLFYKSKKLILKALFVVCRLNSTVNLGNAKYKILFGLFFETSWFHTSWYDEGV